jgi:hypothetical protein
MKQEDGSSIASSSKRKKARKVPPLVIPCGAAQAMLRINVVMLLAL